VENVSVDTWVLHESIDFSNYIDKPVYSIMRFLESSLLDSEKVATQMIHMRFNKIETEDDWVQLG